MRNLSLEILWTELKDYRGMTLDSVALLPEKNGLRDALARTSLEMCDLGGGFSFWPICTFLQDFFCKTRQIAYPRLL